MKGWGKRGRGFTLVETVIATGIIGLIVAVSVVSYKNLSLRTKEKICQANLNTIKLGLYRYWQDNGEFPPLDMDIMEALERYGISRETFRCPFDPTPEDISYQAFYIPRSPIEEAQAFVIGCPWHREKKNAINLLLGYEADNFTITEVRYNTPEGPIIYPGDRVSEGKLIFPNAEVNISPGTEVILVQSFRLKDDTPYGIIRLFSDEGEVEVKVSEGKFEVVTPAAIAGVRGTHFILRLFKSLEGKFEGEVTVYSGEVEVIEQGPKGRKIKVKYGEPPVVAKIKGRKEKVMKLWLEVRERIKKKIKENLEEALKELEGEE